jgi:hypothetical protein
MSEKPVEEAEAAGGLLSSMTKQLSKAGKALDRGMASVLREAGQNIRTKCPVCSGTIETPPDKNVECPLCKHQFISPSVSKRAAEIAKSIKEDLSEALKTGKASEMPEQSERKLGS